MKLINTFLTCTGEVGAQWALDKREERTITCWLHKGQVRTSSALLSDMKAKKEEATARFTTIINRQRNAP